MVPPDYSPTGECAEAYQGLACSECKKGYYRLSNYECKECPNFGSNMAIFVVIVVLVILFFLLIIKISVD